MGIVQNKGILMLLVYRNFRVASSIDTTESIRYQDLDTIQRQTNPDGNYTELRLQSKSVNVEIDNHFQKKFT